MFHKDDFIVYGSWGLCHITAVGRSVLDPGDERIFYTLHPVYSASSSVIYTPVDNDAVIMRLPLSREEAKALLRKMPEIVELTVENEKLRRDVYRAALKTAEPEKLVAVLRSVSNRRNDASRNGRLTDADTDCEKKARDNLSAELGLVLSLSRSEAEELIARSMSSAPTMAGVSED